MNEWKQLNFLANEDSSNMEEASDIDQFQVLEEKIDSLILLIAELRENNNSLTEKTQIQEHQISDLSERVASLTTTKEKAKQRIMTLLEKIEQINI